MNAQELYLQDGKPAGAWYCQKCRFVAASKVLADECCGVKTCACGKPCKPYWLKCDACIDAEMVAKEKARFDASEKLTSWDGPVYCEGFGNDGYCASLDDLLDELEHEDNECWPEYCWACDQVQFVRTDVSDVFSRIVDDGPEDFDTDDLHGLDALKTAMDAFNEANKGHVAWHINNKKSVLIPRKAKP